MKTRDEIIYGMCLSRRHDYGLDRHPDDAWFVSGMTGSERQALWDEMAKIYDEDIAPFMDFKDK